MSSLEELKIAIVKLASVLLIILFLENAFILGPDLGVLYFGLAIAIVVVAFGWVIGQEKKGG